jgi:hypothetical protein
MVTESNGWQPLSDPSVEPATATTNDSITYIVGWDGCGSLLEPSIARHGSLIEIRQPINAFCGIPIGGYVHYDLGRFPPGHYTVHIAPCEQIYPDTPCYPGDSPPDVAFSVISAGALGIPALDGFATATCCAGLMLIGMLRAARGSRVHARRRRE